MAVPLLEVTFESNLKGEHFFFFLGCVGAYMCEFMGFFLCYGVFSLRRDASSMVILNFITIASSQAPAKHQPSTTLTIPLSST